MAVSKIDWNFWFALPRVKVWQAVALSLNIDPDKLKAYQDGPPAQNSDVWKDPVIFHDRHTRDEFDKRSRLLGARVSDRAYFAANNLDFGGNRNLHSVKLVEVAKWLQALGRTPIADGLLAGLAKPEALKVPDPLPRLPVEPTGDAGETKDALLDSKAAPPQKMQIWQEDEILRTTRALGFNPQALPPDDRKRSFFVKSVIRDRCGKNHKIKLRASIFNKAWDRMLSSNPKRLKYAD